MAQIVKILVSFINMTGVLRMDKRAEISEIPNLCYLLWLYWICAYTVYFIFLI